MSDSLDSMDCSPSGFSLHGISQVRILEWVAISFSRGSSQPRIKPVSPALQVDSLPLSHQGRLYIHMYTHTHTHMYRVSTMAQQVKNLSTTQETWVPSLGLEDPLEEGMASHSSILAWGIPWTEEPGRLQSTGLQRVKHNKFINF